MSTLRRAGLCAIGLLASAVLTGGAANADAPKRTFFCGDGQGTIVVTVLSQQTIRADIAMDGAEDGAFAVTMKKRGKGFRFVDGEYEILINNDQNSLIYTAPDFGEIGCVWSP